MLGLWAEYWLPCCCIRDSLLFDMQLDHVLKKSNFDLLTPLVIGGGGGGAAGKQFATMLLHFLTAKNLICNMTMF